MKNPSFLVPRAIACLMAGTLGTIGSVQAAAYLESNYGDFANSGALQTLLLGVGTNTVTGTFGYFGNGSTDFDSFAFLVAAGTALQSMQVDVTPFSGNTHDLVHANWSIRSGSNIAFDGTSIGNLTWDSANPASFSNTLSPGIYNLTNNELNYTGPFQAVAEGNYTFTFNVNALTPIPEPPSYALMLAGLSLLGAFFGRTNKKMDSYPNQLFTKAFQPSKGDGNACNIRSN
jgi:hypothetical protein